MFIRRHRKRRVSIIDCPALQPGRQPRIKRSAIINAIHRFTLVALSVVTLVSAILAAVYWFRSALLRSEQLREPVASISDAQEEHIEATKLYILSICQMVNESSRLNRSAAIWTGISAVLGAVTSIYGGL
jgi:hypothetical protein